ncbi:cactin isoform A [Chlorella sorokiniana]|uniref:Splicing factor Cactin n=1 Tax=Chlorella sorokiniana TaxID=3076 RepID=A0A2P6TNH7_CHLSO|nr:cactin isoform A [Chlorella sorokiniana]|eukprot:PRW50888.1 cactin isoform A [Chlorella sorokiniana]
MGSKEKKHKKEKRRKEKKEKDKKRRRRDSSSDSSGSSSDEDEYKRRKAAKLAKKVAQHLKKHKVTGVGYTDTDNPFGDTNLTERFVWGKKIEKEIASGRDVRDMTARAEMQRQAERLEEIEKVKKRREQREAERAAMAEELELIQRERAIAEAAELEKKEEEFHLEQAKQRTQQRLAAGRPKPIDRLAHGLFVLEDIDLLEDDPTSVIMGRSLRELTELKEDVAAFVELDKHEPLHRDWWAAIGLVVDHELYEEQKREDIDRANMRGEPIPAKYRVREAGWHESIDAEVAAMLAGKPYRELLELESGIQEQLDSGTAADPEYWQAVLKRLALHKAKARLREIHGDILQQHLARMMARPNVAEAMGWGEDGEEAGGAAAARRRAEEAEEEVEESEEEAEAGRRPAPTAEERAAAKAAAADENEIELEEDEEEEGGAGEKGAAGAAGAAGEPALDAELEALARAPGPADVARDAAAAAKARAAAAARGEPRSWDDLSDGEQEVERGAARGRGFSPEPLPPTAYAGQDVVAEEEDTRLLELLRSQVKYKEAQRYREVSAAQAAARPAQAEADRIFRRIMARPGDAGRFLHTGAPPPIAAIGAAGRSAPGQEEAGEAAFLKAADKLMGDLGTSGDAPFGGEVQLDPESQVYWWHDKYRPRRPKYFNRVHTGYEWNKYNQTHYDGDNPPPKTVQGYKFNIFYPELIDKTVAPTYKVDRDPTSDDGSTCILRFSAGPPYEDIAFRILNKEWEYNHKRGFKCVFERGILHLYFNFRRQRYRR